MERCLQGVGLAEQQVLVGDRGDRAVVVQERAATALVDVMERPAVHDVRAGVPIVVDVDVVDRVRRERIEVRSAVRFLKRDEVRQERGVARAVRAGERIHVGVVDRRVGRDEWRLAVAGRTRATGP